MLPQTKIQAQVQQYYLGVTVTQREHLHVLCDTAPRARARVEHTSCACSVFLSPCLTAAMPEVPEVNVWLIRLLKCLLKLHKKKKQWPKGAPHSPGLTSAPSLTSTNLEVFYKYSLSHSRWERVGNLILPFPLWIMRSISQAARSRRSLLFARRT